MGIASPLSNEKRKRGEVTHAEAAAIHVISVDVMSSFFPTVAVITVVAPSRNDPIAIAIVDISANKISWTVDLKHSGRGPMPVFLIGTTAGKAVFSVEISFILNKASKNRFIRK